MNRFYIFRSDLKILEDYHQYDNLEDFKKYSWDFYLNMGIWLLEHNYFDEVIVWRMLNKKKNDIIFEFPNGKKFIQRWVKSLNEVFNYSKSEMSFFRGGFNIYDRITKKNKKFFGKKLYLGANGPRRYPFHGGKYDKILVEDERDIKKNCIPFYKIGVPNIFRPLNLEKKWDICFPANGTQIKYKGQEYFIKQVSESELLRQLRIVNIGNNPEVGRKLCKKYKINNIEFLGRVDRFGVNKALNQSDFGLVTSNDTDGCPRIIMEIMASQTPLLVRKKTRLLKYYRNLECVKSFSDDKLEKAYKKAKKKYEEMKQKNLEYLNSDLNIDKIMKMNVKLWT